MLAKLSNIFEAEWRTVGPLANSLTHAISRKNNTELKLLTSAKKPRGGGWVLSTTINYPPTTPFQKPMFETRLVDDNKPRSL